MSLTVALAGLEVAMYIDQAGLDFKRRLSSPELELKPKSLCPTKLGFKYQDFMDTKHTFAIEYRMFRETHTEGERGCFSAHSYTFYYCMSQLLGCIARKKIRFSVPYCFSGIY